MKTKMIVLWCAGLGIVIVAAGGIYRAQGTTISGVVIDHDTRMPVLDASVKFLPSQADADVSSLTTTSAIDGSFVLLPTDRSRGIVTAEAPGYAAAKRVWPSKKSNYLTIEMQRPVAITGKLLIADSGMPVDGTVTVVLEGQANGTVATVKTLAGSFRAEDLPPGRGYLLVRAPGMAPQVHGLEASAGTVMRNVEIRLQSEAAITGRILDEKGAPVANAEIRVRYSDVPPAFRGVLEMNLGGKPITLTDGVYRIQGLAPDTAVLIQAVHDSRSSVVSAVVLQSGERRQVDLVLR